MESSGPGGHVIVCGLGRVGYRIIDLLWRLGESVSVITMGGRDEWKRELAEKGMLVIEGDARDDKLLIEAGIATAGALIATTGQDLLNIEISLDAKRLNPDLPLILRIFDQTLGQQLESGFDIRCALSMSALAAPTFAAAAMGDRVTTAFRHDDALVLIGNILIGEGSPLANLTVTEAGRKFGAATLSIQRSDGSMIYGPAAESRYEMGDISTVMAYKADWDAVTGQAREPELGRGKRLTAKLSQVTNIKSWFRSGRLLWQSTPLPLRIVFLTLNALALFSLFVFYFGLGLTIPDAIYFLVATVTTTGYGDINVSHAPTPLKLYACLVMLLGSAMVATLYSIITDFIVTARFQQLLGKQRIPHEGHYIVAGLGSVGYRIVDKLRRVGARVVVVDSDPNGRFHDAVRADGPVIIGDARIEETLKKAGVERAYAVVAVTSDDAANLSIGLAAEKLNPQTRTVVRLFDSDFAKKVQSNLPVDVAMGAFKIAAPTFVASAYYSDVRSAFETDDSLIAIIERTAGHVWHGKLAGEIEQEHGVHILMRRQSDHQRYSCGDRESPLESTEQVFAMVRRDLRKAP